MGQSREEGGVDWGEGLYCYWSDWLQASCKRAQVRGRLGGWAEGVGRGGGMRQGRGVRVERGQDLLE